MKMPSAAAAQVPMAKVTDYLLSSTHPRGSLKAVWFEAMGFTLEKPDVLVMALSDHAFEDVRDFEKTEYGTKYCVVGELIGPAGLSRRFCTIWIVLDETEAPRLVTAYPD